ncbi:GNAT family N-acetyltransferase [Staphylospora marina]|uniref:GNAT family N-acetyltransferase n=1 Tax=Staphylospora marina TaxID=2490858 RepID=UPI000F5B9E1C|nr:GNAT family N-acetyltransferase [Staphylospora marina]
MAERDKVCKGRMVATLFLVRRASEEDLFRVRRLLKEAGLNDRGIEPHIRHFFVVERPETEGVPEMVGAVGMEVYGEFGLIRSFVLKRGPWNGKVGVQMMKFLMEYAKELKLSRVYLLAGASSSFFREWGFEETDRESLPEALQKSEHLGHSRGGVPMVCRITVPTGERNAGGG